VAVVSDTEDDGDDDDDGNRSSITEETEDGGGRRKKRRRTAEELKAKVLAFFDRHLAPDAPERRALVARVYGKNSKKIYESNVGKHPGILSNYEGVQHFKSRLFTLPSGPLR